MTSKIPTRVPAFLMKLFLTTLLTISLMAITDRWIVFLASTSDLFANFKVEIDSSFRAVYSILTTILTTILYEALNPLFDYLGRRPSWPPTLAWLVSLYFLVVFAWLAVGSAMREHDRKNYERDPNAFLDAIAHSRRFLRLPVRDEDKHKVIDGLNNSPVYFFRSLLSAICWPKKLLNNYVQTFAPEDVFPNVARVGGMLVTNFKIILGHTLILAVLIFVGIFVDQRFVTKTWNAAMPVSLFGIAYLFLLSGYLVTKRTDLMNVP